MAGHTHLTFVRASALPAHYTVRSLASLYSPFSYATGTAWMTWEESSCGSVDQLERDEARTGG